MSTPLVARALLRPASWLVPLWIALPLGAQWTCDPDQNQPLVVQPQQQSWPLLGMRSDGGFWLGWRSDEPTGIQVRLQRFDRDATPLLGPNGVLVSDGYEPVGLRWDLITDSTGAAVIALTDMRDDPSREVYAYRFDAQGTPLWGSAGVRVSTTLHRDDNPKIAELTNGDFAVVWSSDPNTPVVAGTIQMQRIAADGVPQFQPNGRELADSDPITAPQRPDVLALEDNAVLVAWNSGLQFPVRVFARRFSGLTAEPQWIQPVPVLDDPTSGTLDGPGLHRGSGGNNWIAFNLSGQGRIGPVVQRLDPNGQELLPHDGLLLAEDSSTGSTPDVARDPATDAVMLAWIAGIGNDYVARAQRIEANGSKAWPSAGVDLSSLSSTFKEAVVCEATPQGGALVAWIEWHADGMRIVAQRIAPDGALEFGPGGVEVSAPGGFKFQLTARARPAGDVVLAWEDAENWLSDVLGQLVDSSGGLGGPALGAYCAAKTDDAGCTPMATWSGTPSLTLPQPFTIGAESVASQRAGALVYGRDLTSLPFAGGELCAQPPLTLIGLQHSGGNDPGTCSGTYLFDFGAWLAGGQDAQIEIGMTVSAQWWYRAPALAGGGIGLSDAIAFTLCP